MSNRKLFSILRFTVFLVLVGLLFVASKPNSTNEANTKIILREVGNRLLLSEQDSTSIVLPIIVTTENRYRISFENTLRIQPDSLVFIMASVIQESEFSNHYLVEVFQCKSDEVAYSYKINTSTENNIIPCIGRQLPDDCYHLEVEFLDVENLQHSQTAVISVAFLGLLALTGFEIYSRKKEKISLLANPSISGIDLGKFQFLPEEHQLNYKNKNIKLSNKECELLSIFVTRPNEIIKREELSKKVWEDKGVFVGRSLDTYVSKLRKVLKPDNNIKLINVHGVGYKLVVKKRL